MRLPSIIRQALTITFATIAVCSAQAQLRSYTITSAPLRIDTTTSVPGADLKSGSYTIRVIDNLKDRYILGVDNARKKEVATFIGVLQHEHLTKQGGAGPILWANAPGKTSALRGFSFANGLSFEFVYPKATAVELAKLNTSSVLAIDPESEGMPVDPALSTEDRKVVTLWMLTSTRVGSGSGTPAIEAKRYQTNPSTELAQNDAPPSPAVAAQNSAPAPKALPMERGTTDPAPVTAPIAKAKHKAIAARLPQTASELPLTLLLSFSLLAAGIFIGVGRRMRPSA